MDWPNLYMYKQSKSREKRRIMLSEYSPSPETAAEALCPAFASTKQAGGWKPGDNSRKRWKNVHKAEKDDLQGEI